MPSLHSTMGRLPSTDFSSAAYWSARFSSERSFEWLSPSEALLPLLLDIARDIAASRGSFLGGISQREAEQEQELGISRREAGREQELEVGGSSHPDTSPSDQPLHILHFGCGTSSLGIDLARALEAEQPRITAEVIDADYVAADIQTAIPSAIPSVVPSAIPSAIPGPIPGPISGPIPGSIPTPSLGPQEVHTSAGGDADAAIGQAGGVERGRADPPRPIPLISLNVLDAAQMAEKAPEGGWDLLVDKSTADAISCGPNVDLGPKLSAGDESGSEGLLGDERGPGERGGHGDTSPAASGTGVGEPEAKQAGGADGTTMQTQKRRNTVEPIVALCERLGAVTRPGGRWVCISYSERRFAHLEARQRLPPSPSLTYPTSTSRRGENGGEGEGQGKGGSEGGSEGEGIGMGWKLLHRLQLDDAQPGGRVVADGKGERVVFGPKTGAWVYVLERLGGGGGGGGGVGGEAEDAVEGAAEDLG